MQSGYRPGLLQTYETRAPFVGDEVLLGSGERYYDVRKVGTVATVGITIKQSAREPVVHCRYYLREPARGVMVADTSIPTQPFNTIYLHATAGRNVLLFGWAESDAPEARTVTIRPNLNEWQYNAAADGLGESTLEKLNRLTARKSCGALLQPPQAVTP